MTLYRMTVETDRATTEYENIEWYAIDRQTGFLALHFVDGSMTEINPAIVRELDVAVQP